MTIQEILKAQGLTDEQIEAVVGEMKQNKIFTASEENLDVRYGKLKGDHDAKLGELTEAQKLIEELKKSTGDSESLQAKIAEYEAKNAELAAENEKVKVEAALKVALLEAKAADIDYLTFKIREKGEIKLDDNGKIAGIEDTIAALKTQYPTQFTADSTKKIEEMKLEKSEDDQKISKEDFAKMGYQQRLKLHREDPETYKALTE